MLYKLNNNVNVQHSAWLMKYTLYNLDFSGQIQKDKHLSTKVYSLWVVYYYAVTVVTLWYLGNNSCVF